MVSTDFDEVRFPEKVEFGVSGGPQFFTEIATTAGGFEQRSQNWTVSRAKYNAAFNLLNQTEFDEVLSFFYKRKGRALAFRFRDWMDFCSDMPGIIANPLSTADSNTLPAAGVLTPTAVATGTTGVTDYQLKKTYTVGSETTTRDITKIATDGTAGAADPSASLRVFLDAVEQTEGGGNDYVVNSATGVITFNTPLAGGEVITADFFFDVPVRFEKDAFEGVKTEFNVNEWGGIGLIEVRI